MAARTLSAARSRLRSTELATLVSPGAVLLALSVPIIFVHATYQPSWSLSLVSTTVTIYLADLAVLAVAAAALSVLVQDGPAALRRGRVLFAVAAGLLAWTLVATLYGPAVTDGYRFAKHLVTAAKYWEYGALALAVPLLVRRRAEAWLLVAVLVAWSTAATIGGLLQFLGLVNEFEGRRPGQREPSFLGVHDFAALSGAALAVGIAALAFAPADHRVRRLAWVGGLSGSVGLVLSGALAGVAGIGAAAVLAAVLAHRRGALSLARVGALAAVVGACAVGVIAIRSAEIDSVLEFFGVEPAEDAGSLEGASQAQRTVLLYIGGRAFLDHPLLGVGWQGTSEPPSFEPYLADARARFPDVPALSFPSRRHRWGVQNAYLQAAADLGIVGLALFVALFAAGLVLGTRAALRAPPDRVLLAVVPILWLCVTMGVWLGLGIVAGIPLVALQWLALGLSAAAVGPAP